MENQSSIGTTNPDIWKTRFWLLHDLLADMWFFDEMENANYHSAYDFLQELKREAEKKYEKGASI